MPRDFDDVLADITGIDINDDIAGVADLVDSYECLTDLDEVLRTNNKGPDNLERASVARDPLWLLPVAKPGLFKRGR